MKKLTQEIIRIIFCAIVLLIVFAVCMIAELLSRVITMQLIMKAMNIILFLGFIYVIKERRI